MKVLVISHSAVVADYRERFRQIALYPEIDLTLLVPRRWKQFNRMIEMEKTGHSNYRIISRQPLTWGLRQHGLRNVTHIYPGMGKLIKEIRPEIIELWEEPFSAVTAHIIRISRKIIPGAKIIFFSAQNIPKNYPPPFSWFERYTYRQADFAFAMNREVKEIIREKGWGKGSMVLPLGVNPDQFRKSDCSDLREKLGLTGFSIGYVGKLDKQKGVIDLIEAVAQLPEPANLLIIGDGPLKKEVVNEVRRRGIGERVTMIDSIDHGQLPGYLNCMDILVLPSITLPRLKEQFGRVLIEAMSCEVPVIGSDSGEIPNVIGDAGLIFPENHIDQLTNHLRLIMNNHALRQRLSVRGRERVMLNYSWEKIAQKQIGIYERLMDT